MKARKSAIQTEQFTRILPVRRSLRIPNAVRSEGHLIYVDAAGNSNLQLTHNRIRSRRLNRS